MPLLRTASGKEFQCDYFNDMEELGTLYIRIQYSSLAEVAATFGNPAETVQLWYGEEYAALYTKLTAIIPESGCIRVNLQRG